MIFGRNFGRNFQRLDPRRKKYHFKSLDDEFFSMFSPWGKFATWRYLSDIFHAKIAYHHSSHVTLEAYDRMMPRHAGGIRQEQPRHAGGNVGEMVNFFTGSDKNTVYVSITLNQKNLTLDEHQKMHNWHGDATLNYWLVYKEEGDNPPESPIPYSKALSTDSKIAFEFPVPGKPRHYHCRIKYQYGNTVDYLKDHFDVDFLDPLG